MQTKHSKILSTRRCDSFSHSYSNLRHFWFILCILVIFSVFIHFLRKKSELKFFGCPWRHAGIFFREHILETKELRWPSDNDNCPYGIHGFHVYRTSCFAFSHSRKNKTNNDHLFPFLYRICSLPHYSLFWIKSHSQTMMSHEWFVGWIASQHTSFSAIIYFQRHLKIARSLEDTSGQLRSYYSLALSFNNLRDRRKALYFLVLAKRISLQVCFQFFDSLSVFFQHCILLSRSTSTFETRKKCLLRSHATFIHCSLFLLHSHVL